MKTANTRKLLKSQKAVKALSTRKHRRHLKAQKTDKYPKPQTSSKTQTALTSQTAKKYRSTLVTRIITNIQNTQNVRHMEKSDMDIHHITTLSLIIIFTLVSGLCDAQGFLHASSIWEGKKFIWSEATKSALGFSLGTGLYWICIRFLKEFKIIAPEIQTIVWFSMTILSVALFSRTFLQWQRMDQIVGVLVFLGVLWLLVRIGM